MGSFLGNWQLRGAFRDGMAFESLIALQTPIMRETKGTYRKEYSQNNPFKEFLYKDDSRLLDEERYQHDHYIRAANQLLAAAAKQTWIAMKRMVKIAIRLPRLFVKVNTTRSN
jgi:hypothetical protein